MRFSVLTPVYNTSAYLAACVSSVLGQDFSDFELVLIDDGSTDGSGALCDTFSASDSRVRVFHTENRGLLAARRRAIAEARGEICVSLDSDDLLAPEALSQLHRRLGAPEAPDIIIFNFACFTDACGPFALEPPVFTDGRVFCGEAGKAPVYEALVSGWTLNNFVTKAIRTELLRADTTDYAPYFSCSHSEDLLQSLEPVTQAGVIAYCALPLYRYRRNAQSMTRALDASRIASQFNRPVMERLAAFLPRWGLDTPAWRERLAVRQLSGLLSVFYQACRSAENAAGRRAVARFCWADMVDAETRACTRSPLLSRTERLALSLLLGRGAGTGRIYALRALALAVQLRRSPRREGR